MRIEQLEYFLTIARYGSISQAANNLYIGQPTLSAAINSLEKELDTKLFKRTKSGMELTPMGEEMLPLAEKTIDDFYAIKKKASKKTITKSQIHISCNSSCCTAMLDIVAKCKRFYPTVSLYVHNMLPTDVIRSVVEGTSTIGLSSASDYAIPRNTEYAESLNLALEKLYTDQLCFCCQADDRRFAGMEVVSFPDIMDEPMAIPEGLIHQGIFKHSSVYSNFSNLVAFSSQESLKKYIAANNEAYALLPKLATCDDIYFTSGYLRAIRLSDHPTNQIHYLTYCQDHQFSEVEEEILRLIRKYYTESLCSCLK